MDITWQPGNTLEDIEKRIIKKALLFYSNNKSATARSLGISVRTIDNKLAQYAQEEIDSAKPKERATTEI